MNQLRPFEWVTPLSGSLNAGDYPRPCCHLLKKAKDQKVRHLLIFKNQREIYHIDKAFIRIMENDATLSNSINIVSGETPDGSNTATRDTHRVPVGAIKTGYSNPPPKKMLSADVPQMLPAGA